MATEAPANDRWYRLIVTCDDASDVLLARDGNLYKLPSVEVASGGRLAQAVTTAGRACCDGDLLYLFLARSSASIPGHLQEHDYCVLEHVGARSDRYSGYDWISATQLSAEDFREPLDFEAVSHALQTARRSLYDSASGPFARLGWWKQISTGIEDEIHPRGYHVTGVRHLNGAPRFALLRIETNGPAFWFKAVGEPNTREVAITLALVNLLPKYVPWVVASFPECNGWLAADAPGGSLEQAGLPQWITAATSLAELQISSIKHLRTFEQAGARDLSSAVLQAAIGPCMKEITQAMQQQEKPSPAPLDNHAIRDIGEQLSLALCEAEDLHIPDTLGHLDLNPANVIVSSSQCTFLDWCEAYIGNPFFSFEYLREHFRRSNGSLTPPAPTLEETYWNRWRALLPSHTLDTAQKLAPLLAVFAYAVAVLLDSTSEHHARQQAYARSLGRRMKQETDRLVAGRSLCRVP